jgi:hypothetical protein
MEVPSCVYSVEKNRFYAAKTDATSLTRFSSKSLKTVWTHAKLKPPTGRAAQKPATTSSLHHVFFLYGAGMSELQVQLLIVFCFKQVLLGSLEIIIPFMKARARATVPCSGEYLPFKLEVVAGFFAPRGPSNGAKRLDLNRKTAGLHMCCAE